MRFVVAERRETHSDGGNGAHISEPQTLLLVIAQTRRHRNGHISEKQLFDFAEMLQSPLESTIELGGAVADRHWLRARGGWFATQYNKFLTHIAAERLGDNAVRVRFERTPVVFVENNAARCARECGNRGAHKRRAAKHVVPKSVHTTN
jgi:hypothetical protein